MEFNFNLANITTKHRAIPLDPKVVYDVLIIGGGPAGLTAAVYCMRKGVKTALVTDTVGGQLQDTLSIENYLGYTHIEGMQLVRKFKEQVEQFEIAYGEGLKVKAITTSGTIKKITIENGDNYQSKTLIIVTGKAPKTLNVPGEKEFTGRGVAYCSACDAPLFKGKKVAVIGGGNSGVEAAIDLARVAKHVTVVEFLNKINADLILKDRLNEFANVDMLLQYKVLSIEGNNYLKSLELENLKSHQKSKLNVEGLFVEIGLIPNSGFVRGKLSLNEQGEIIVDCACRTNVSGIFAAGDVTTVPYKQIIIAAGEGAKAALSACEYVLKN